jgi:hypothetical protein
MDEVTIVERDPEIKALEASIEYLKAVPERDRVRFMYHLTHRYFPKGRFAPEEPIFTRPHWDPEDFREATKK